MNIEDYRPLIEQLKPLVKDPDFEDLLARFLRSEPTKKQFFIKMELKRLAEPCIRVLDVRSRAGESCREVQAGSITHYLDSATQAVFDAQMKIFGRYTMGVYEAVIDKDKALRAASKMQMSAVADEQTDDQQSVVSAMYNLPLLHLGKSVKRQSERLILSAKVTATLPADREIEASISDFSIQGMKLRVDAHIYLIENAQISIDLSFMRARDDHESDHWQATYRLLGIHKQNNLYKWLRLQRVDNDALLSERIQRYFEAQHKRLTVDTDASVESVRARGFEDAYFRQMSAVPVLIGLGDNGLEPQVALRSEANSAIFDFWRGLDGNVWLGDVFTPARLREMAANARNGQATLFYCFNHLSGGKLHYYVASHQQLVKEGLLDLFFGFASHRDSWRVFSASIHTLSVDDAERPLSLPDDLPEYKHQPIDRATRARLKPLKGVIYLFDVTSRTGTHCYRSNYSASDQNPNDLKRFQIATGKMTIHEEAFEFRHQRSEVRYLYRTPINAKIAERAATGTTLNLSGKGLQVQLKKPLPLAVGDPISISLPQLQKLNSKVKLMEVPYRVVAMNQSQTLISMRINSDTVHPTVVPFLKQLLKTNDKKLKRAAENLALPEYVSSLRNMLVPTLPHPTMFISRVDKKIDISHIASSNDDNGLVSFLQQLFGQTEAKFSDGVNLTFLQRGERFNQTILRPLRVLQEGGGICYVECLVAAVRNYKGDVNQIDCLYVMNNTEPEQIRAFIEAAKKKSDLFALRLTLSRYGNPDMMSINKELHYISDYATHKAQALEKELASIMGIGEIIDITDEMLIRAGLHQSAPNAKEAS
ncbi:pilus assembly protein PilZ [Neiella marina]|uniref:Pilus assembly protein PilZ n=1 Tax=Neiella marina TaxID=508461 RepID=A0A8J2XMN1_9GAMM|nr:PilZ domain-containing protein [Neiella marina]GGA66102.1 pilus assembly protein PilZ [Neiella marina]